MLIHQKLPAGHLYPQITQFPSDYTNFWAAFRDGQTIDNNLDARDIMNTTQNMIFRAAITSRHLEKRGNPIQGESLLDIFLTQKGKGHIREPQDKQFCEMAVQLAKKSIAENDGELHPYVGAVIVKDGKVLSSGYGGETGEGRHAEYCALKKLNDDVDKVDLSGCTILYDAGAVLEAEAAEDFLRNPSDQNQGCASRVGNARQR